MASLAARSWASLVGLAAVMGAVLFLSAGTVRYWQGWVYLAVFTGASLVITLDLLRRDPALLERRMRGGPTAEKRGAQKIIMLFASLSFVALLVVPALDRRFAWSRVPLLLEIAGDVLVAVGFYFIAIVYRANTYTAATVQVAEGQKVVSTGPYAIVRHPMYASASIYLIGTPLALGSWWGFLPLAVFIPFLIWRLIDEERMLVAELPGYVEYQRGVRYRLVPGLW